MNTEQIEKCKELCWRSRDTCQTTLFTHRLQMGDEYVAEAHVKIMIDCIEMCQLSADFITRESDMHVISCAACADVCDRCAVSCEQIGGDHMLACADICRECADACRSMGH